MTDRCPGGLDREFLERFAREAGRPGAVVTWLNHWSLLHADWPALSRMRLIGFDGTLLQMVLHHHGHRVGRSSADLVLPIVLDEVLAPDDRVALIGAAPGVAAAAAGRLGRHPAIVFDGYGGLEALLADPSALVDVAPRLVVIGLGAGLQERVALRVHEWLPDAAVVTAGGWLDQLDHAEQYFPGWVHRMRLGWAWRIVHEPRRLCGRYTIEAARFLLGAGALVELLETIGPFNGLGIDRCTAPGPAGRWDGTGAAPAASAALLRGASGARGREPARG